MFLNGQRIQGWICDVLRGFNSDEQASQGCFNFVAKVREIEVPSSERSQH